MLAVIMVTSALVATNATPAMAGDTPAEGDIGGPPPTSEAPLPVPQLGPDSPAYRQLKLQGFFRNTPISVYEIRPGIGVTSAKWDNGRYVDRPDAEMRPLLQDYVDIVNEWATTVSGRALLDTFARLEPIQPNTRWRNAATDEPSSIHVVFTPENGVAPRATPDPRGFDSHSSPVNATTYGSDSVIEGNPRSGLYYVDKNGSLKYMAPGETYFHEAIHSALALNGASAPRGVYDYPADELVFENGAYRQGSTEGTELMIEEFLVHGGPKGLAHARETQKKWGLSEAENAYLARAVEFAEQRLADPIPSERARLTRVLAERTRYSAAGITELKYASERGIPVREEYVTNVVKGGPAEKANLSSSMLDGSRRVTDVSAAERADPRGTGFYVEDRLGVSGVPAGAKPIAPSLGADDIVHGRDVPTCGGSAAACKPSRTGKKFTSEEVRAIDERVEVERKRVKPSPWAELIAELDAKTLPGVARATVSGLTDEQVGRVATGGPAEKAALPEFVAGLEGTAPQGKIPLPLGEETVKKLNRGLKLAASEVLSGEGLANAAAWLYSVGLAFAEDSTTLDKVTATAGIVPVVGPVLGIVQGAKADDPRSIAINSLFLAAQLAAVSGNELAALVLTVAAFVVDAVWSVVDQITSLIKGDPRKEYTTAYLEGKLRDGFAQWAKKSMDTAMDGIWAAAKESFDRAEASLHWDSLVKQAALEEQGAMLGARTSDIEAQQAANRASTQKNAETLRTSIKNLLSTSLAELTLQLNTGEPYRAFRDKYVSDVLTPAYRKDMVAYCEATTSGEEGAAAAIICQRDEYKKAQFPEWQLAQLSAQATAPLDAQPWQKALEDEWSSKGPKVTAVPRPAAPALRDLPWKLTSPTPGTSTPVSNTALITGFGPAGRGVEVWSKSGQKICTSMVSDRGYWGCSPANALPEGTVTELQVKSSDGVVRASTPITISGTALAVNSPTRGTQIEYQAGSAPTLADWTGSGKPGATLTVFTFCGTGSSAVSRELPAAGPDGSRQNITVGATGRWRYTPQAADYTPGTYCSVSVADKALNSMAWSDFTTVPVGGQSTLTVQAWLVDPNSATSTTNVRITGAPGRTLTLGISCVSATTKNEKSFETTLPSTGVQEGPSYVPGLPGIMVVPPGAKCTFTALDKTTGTSASTPYPIAGRDNNTPTSPPMTTPVKKVYAGEDPTWTGGHVTTDITTGVTGRAFNTRENATLRVTGIPEDGTYTVTIALDARNSDLSFAIQPNNDSAQEKTVTVPSKTTKEVTATVRLKKGENTLTFIPGGKLPTINTLTLTN